MESGQSRDKDRHITGNLEAVGVKEIFENYGKTIWMFLSRYIDLLAYLCPLLKRFVYIIQFLAIYYE